MVGPELGPGPELRKLTEELGLTDSQGVLCRGTTRRPTCILRFGNRLLPSTEPFGLVLLDAGAFRLSVIATVVGGIREFSIMGKSRVSYPFMTR
jgi:hypothetical protein